MKFLDLINEEEYRTPEQQRELKKAKTLFKALQNGVVKINHPMKDDGGIILRYQIHDNVNYRWETHGGKDYITIITNNIPGEGITIETDSEFAMKRYEKDSNSVFSEHMRHVVSSSIRRKFINFGVNVHINQSGFKFVLDKPEQEPINEVSEEFVNKRIQKGKAIYKLLKTGLIGSKAETDEPMFRYELSDDPSISYRDDLGLTIFVSRVKVIQLNRSAVTASIGRIQSKINERFKRFDITLSYPTLTSDDVETNIIEEM